MALARTRILIGRGLAALERANALGGPRGPYVLQAEITACHARAHAAPETDWNRIAALYGELGALLGSPVVELNRAVAISMAEGPEAALAIVEELAKDPTLRNYHLLPSARADFLAKLGRWREAQTEFEKAAALTRNVRHRERLLERAAECEGESKRVDS